MKVGKVSTIFTPSRLTGRRGSAIARPGEPRYRCKTTGSATAGSPLPHTQATGSQEALQRVGAALYEPRDPRPRARAEGQSAVACMPPRTPVEVLRAGIRRSTLDSNRHKVHVIHLRDVCKGTIASRGGACGRSCVRWMTNLLPNECVPAWTPHTSLVVGFGPLSSGEEQAASMPATRLRKRRQSG
jgi:hypothetical protein